MSLPDRRTSFTSSFSCSLNLASSFSNFSFCLLLLRLLVLVQAHVALDHVLDLLALVLLQVQHDQVVDVVGQEEDLVALLRKASR